MMRVTSFVGQQARFSGTSFINARLCQKHFGDDPPLGMMDLPGYLMDQPVDDVFMFSTTDARRDDQIRRYAETLAQAMDMKDMNKLLYQTPAVLDENDRFHLAHGVAYGEGWAPRNNDHLFKQA
jgi:hypothetical protein